MDRSEYAKQLKSITVKKKKILQYIVLPIVLIIGAIAIYFYKEYNRTHKDVSDLNADYAVTATNLLNEFESNEQSSNKKYWDKVIEVEGIAKDLVKDAKGFYTIVLGDPETMSAVRCSIDSAHNNEANSITKGKNIKIKGICSGFNSDELLGSDVVLVRSVVQSTN